MCRNLQKEFKAHNYNLATDYNNVTSGSASYTYIFKLFVEC